jgi:hypothetical protein
MDPQGNASDSPENLGHNMLGRPAKRRASMRLRGASAFRSAVPDQRDATGVTSGVIRRIVTLRFSRSGASVRTLR